MIVINGKEIETDAEGYLAQLDDWSEDIASYLAQQDNLQLTEEHWKLLNWIRALRMDPDFDPKVLQQTQDAPFLGVLFKKSADFKHAQNWNAYSR